MSDAASGPAYRIVTERLVLRCWAPTDAPLLKEAIDASVSHLRPWLPWAAAEPEAVESKVRRIRRWRANFDNDDDFIYGVFDRTETRVLGGCGLHTRAGEGAREIGYWVRASHVRQGLATELAAALTRVGFEVGTGETGGPVGRIEIHCDPENGASAAVPRKLGYTHEATLRADMQMPDGTFRPTMLWTMLAGELAGSAAATMAARVSAYDVLGGRLL